MLPKDRRPQRSVGRTRTETTRIRRTITAPLFTAHSRQSMTNRRLTESQHSHAGRLQNEHALTRLTQQDSPENKFRKMTDRQYDESTGPWLPRKHRQAKNASSHASPEYSYGAQETQERANDRSHAKQEKQAK